MARYSDAVKEKVIQDFVVENSRAPSEDELRLLLFEANKQYKPVPSIGFTGLNAHKVKVKEVSSAANENTTREAIWRDLKVTSDITDGLFSDLERRYRNFTATAGRVNRLLRTLEARAANLVLVNSRADNFFYGFEEDFVTPDNIDYAATTATVDRGFVTLGRRAKEAIGLSNAVLSGDLVSSKGNVNTVAVGSLDNLKQQDGSTWSLLGYTTFDRGRVTARLDITLIEPEYVSALKIYMKPVSGNSKTTATVLYTLDGESFVSTDTQEETIAIGANQFEIGADKVKTITLLLSKEAADSETDARDEFVYAFSFDAIELIRTRYTNKLTSEVVLGPYDLYDELGNPVYFTRATCEACILSPVNTSVNFFLSKDASSWTPVAIDTNALRVVVFDENKAADSADEIDGTLATGLLVGEPEVTDVDFASEAALNKFIKEAWVSFVSPRSITIKRGTSDWVETAAGYKTTLYVEVPEGLYLDLGSTSALLNGNRVSGVIHIKQGYSTFETSDTNWYDVSTGLTTSVDLRNADPLYPYNHKLLIEGYGYSDNFAGERIYQGVAEYFARLLEYVTPEQFEAASDGNYDIYTTDTSEGPMYFKVKVDKSNNDWSSEVFDADWTVQSSSSNQLYVRIVLNASTEDLTPRVDSFKVRVI